MKRLLEQLDSIEAIVDTVSSAQIEHEPQSVRSRYELYASNYEPIERVKALRSRLIDEIGKGKPVNGYLSADYGYGKTATLIYLWHECQLCQIVAVPPFKFKELGDLMVATYGWIKACINPELIPQVDALYRKYGYLSQQEQAAEIARKHKLSEAKALKIVQEFKTDITNTDNVLNFWRESVPILRLSGMKGLAIFADESQEFLRTQEGSSVRIQILSDLVKGMRALGNTPVALILSMPTDPTESAIEEQAGDIIHRMKEQKVSLRLADAYNYEFPGKLWEYLCTKFLDQELEGKQLAHPATIESLGQLCDRKDLSNGPRAVIEVFKRLVHFAQEQGRSYTPMDLIDDYLTGRVQFYGTGQHRINNAIDTLEQLISIQKHPKGQEVVKLLAIFPAGVTESIAEQFGLLKSLKELAEDDNLYGLYIIQPTEHSFALVSLSKPTTPTVVDKILNRFRQQWFVEWNNTQKESIATTIFRSEIIPLLFPVSRSGQKANWNWRYKNEWKQDRFGFYNFLNGAPTEYNAEFPNRSLVISIGTDKSKLMRFTSKEETHLDWRFYLDYDRGGNIALQRLTAIAGTGQVDFCIQLGRSFERQYPATFGLLGKVMPPEQCSACTLLNLSFYIQDWLLKNPEVGKADRARLEHHRKECHQYALRLLFPAVKAETWIIEGLENINGAETKLVDSVFYHKSKVLFPEYKSFYNNLRPSLLKYKLALEKVPLAVRRGNQLHQVNKEEFEQLFETAGSSLPSVLAIFKNHSLISEYKIASKKEENSQVSFSEHPLESFIQKQLKLRGKILAVSLWQGQLDVKALNIKELWEDIKKLGYLQEEFEEAIEWLQRRRYIELERTMGILRQAVAQLEPDDLKGKLNELRTQVSSLLEAFDEKLLYDVEQSLNEAQQTLVSVAATLVPSGDDTAQLNLFNETASESDKQQSLSNVVLDQVQRKIQSYAEQIEEFCNEKRSFLQKELAEIKLKLDNVTLELNVSKVSQPISPDDSGLEPCLNNYRKHLQRQVEQLDFGCKNLATKIVFDEPDILILHHQIKLCYQSLKTYEKTKTTLQDLVAGCEQWRIILTRAEALRQNLTNNPQRLMRYDDEFVDRVVTHFATHKIESFREYELLQRPLIEIEEQINTERQVRREDFDQLLSRYEELLGQVGYHEGHLRNRCKFDYEDHDGSYHSLRQVFLEKLLFWCDSQISEWEQLEQNLFFIAQEREQDVTEFLDQISHLKNQLLSQKNLCKEAIADIENLEGQVNELKSVFEKGLSFCEELRKYSIQKDENILEEERQFLSVVNTVRSSITISQLCQNWPDNQKVWELLKSLYKKGYLEITLRQRD
jgi:hypothetical protein